MAPPLTPRARPTYDWATDGQSTQGSMGSLILPGVDVQVRKPSWHGKETVFRPYPCPMPEDPMNQFDPYRMDPGGVNKFSDWIERYDVAWSVGNPATTFILHNPAVRDYGYDKWRTPLGVLYRAIKKATESGQADPTWYPLLTEIPGKGKQLAPPKEAYFLQGCLVKYDDKVTFGDGKAPMGWGPNPPVVLMLSGGCGRKLVNTLQEETEDYRGDQADFEARYVNGDPVSVDFGRFIHIFQKGHDPRHKYMAQPSVKGASPFATDGSYRSSRTDDGDPELGGFDLFLTKDGNMGLPSTLNEQGQLDMIRQQWRWWDRVLLFPTLEQQAHILCDIFPASACAYAFQDHDKEWISEKCQRKLVAAVTVPVHGPSNLQSSPFHARPSAFPPPQPQPQPSPAHVAAQSAGVPFVTQQPVVQSETLVQDTVVPEADIPQDSQEQPSPTGFKVSPPPVAPSASGEVQARSAASVAKMAAARAAAKKG